VKRFDFIGHLDVLLPYELRCKNIICPGIVWTGNEAFRTIAKLHQFIVEPKSAISGYLTWGIITILVEVWPNQVTGNQHN
jgi:hypothetical protein